MQADDFKLFYIQSDLIIFFFCTTHGYFPQALKA